MSTVRIHYFSGTGNTERAVGIFRQHLAEKGYTTEIRQITTEKPVREEGLAEEVIAFPTLGFSAPAMVKKYARRLPPGNGRKMAVLCVNAGGPMQAIRQMVHILKNRGYSVSLTASAGYPQNWIQFMPSPNAEEVQSRTENGDTLALAFARDYVAGVKHLDHPGTGTLVMSVPIAFLFVLLGRRLLGKAFIANEDCTSCGLCRKMCPSHTIRMSGSPARPVWKANCQNCNRCMNLCPAHAIVTSNLRLGVHMGLFVILSALAVIAGIVSGRYLSGILPGFLPLAAGCAFFILASAILFIAQYSIIDFFLTFVLQRLFPKAFRKTFNTDIRRYCAPGFKPAGTEKL